MPQFYSLRMTLQYFNAPVHVRGPDRKRGSVNHLYKNITGYGGKDSR
jgi:hypothetical protein